MNDTQRATRARFLSEVEAVANFLRFPDTIGGHPALDYYRSASALRTLADTAQRIADAYSDPIL